MIPLGDSVAGRSRPTVTLLLIGACVLVFLYELTLRGPALEVFVDRWGVVSADMWRLVNDRSRAEPTELLTLFTSQFLHAGPVHLGGNMVFLWVFGRAVEERFGSPVYLVFYLLAGAAAALVQVVVSGPRDVVPMLGASGAIAAVLGAYLVSYPRAWVTVLLPVLFFYWAFALPALLVLLFWFVTQLFNGIAAITDASRATGSVAFWAHTGGFLVGMVVAPRIPARVAAKGSRRSPAFRDANAPGPARLVASVADLLALLLGVRAALLLLGWAGPTAPFAVFTTPVLAVTAPVVEPIADVLPVVWMGGRPVDVPSLTAMFFIYVVAGLLGRLLIKRPER